MVGSTSNILGFIKDQTREAVARDGGGRGGGEKLSFVLGTESGMITSIVRSVQEELKVQGNSTQVMVLGKGRRGWGGIRAEGSVGR